MHASNKIAVQTSSFYRASTILLRELWGFGSEAYLCSVSHGASLVITETETEGLDKDVFEYNSLTKYLLYGLSSGILMETTLFLVKPWPYSNSVGC